MKKNLGIFLNNTDSELKFKINSINYKNLINNFDIISIIDLDNEYSNKLKNFINNKTEKKIITYILNNNIEYNTLNDFNSKKIIHICNDLKFSKYNNITFINDNYIYYDNLKNYFDYCNLHNLDFSSITDSCENQYHYQLYFFTIKSSLMDKFINYIKTNNSNMHYDVINIFENKMPYLKVAYLENNNSNLYFNENLYKYFINNDILPIININMLNHLLSNYNYVNTKFNSIPENFNINVYRQYDDLKNLEDEKLYNHFINYGQYELRKYSSTNNYVNYVLPIFIRNKLISLDLLYYFDIPDSFNLFIYKDNNEDLKSISEKDLVIHWINYGRKENRIYF